MKRLKFLIFHWNNS